MEFVLSVKQISLWTPKIFLVLRGRTLL